MDFPVFLRAEAVVGLEFAKLNSNEKIAMTPMSKAIIPLILTFVNPVVCLAGESLERLTAKVIKTGEPLNLWENAIADNLKIPKGVSGRTVEIPEQKSEDGAYRLCAVGLEGDDDSPKPAFIVFNWILKSPGESESFYVATDLKGQAKNGFVMTGKFEEGKPVRGSAVTRILELDSPELKRRLGRELDFWLKGRGRKKGGGARH